MITIAYDQSVRTLMVNSGYDNSKIGYDPSSGYVQYNGQNFMKPQMNVNGTTYTDQSTFDSAHNQFKQQNPGSFDPNTPNSPYQGGIFKSAEDSMPYEQRFGYYAQNPQAAQNEYNRANQVLGVYNATGDTQRAQDAAAHIQRLQQVMGAQQAAQPQQQGPNVNDLVGQILQRVNNPQQFDVYNSPQYKAAQSQAAYDTQQNVRSAQEALGTAGIGRSSTLQDQAQRFGNEANQRLMTQVVPQLIQQQRDYEQQRTGNLMGLLSPLLQQQQNKISEAGVTGMYNGQQTLAGKTTQANLEQIHAALTGTMANGDPTYQAKQDTIRNAMDSVDKLGYVDAQASKILGIPVGTTSRAMQVAMNDMAYKNANLGLKAAQISDMAGYHNIMAGASVTRANAAQQNAQNNANKNKTPKKTANDYKTDPNFAQDVAHMKANPNDAKQLETNPQPFIDAYGYDGYLALRKSAGLD